MGEREMKLSYYAGMKGITGYAKHSRELNKALIKEGIELTGESIGTPALIISTPEQYCLYSGNQHKPYIAYLVFEGSKLSKHWVECCNKKYITHLIVPSKHVRETAINSGVKKPISVIPHGVDTSIYKPNVKKSKKLKNNKFTFLMVGGWAQGILDRKGFQYALKAFFEEFNPEEPVEIVWKINMNYNPNLNINEELIKLKLPNKKHEIKIITKELTEDEMATLYKTANVLICPSMDEGFGMSALESMSVGTPVMCTEKTGMTDFVNKTNGWWIKTIKSIKSPGLPTYIYENAVWKVPSVKHLKKLMRNAVNNPELVMKKGMRSALTAEKYSWKHTAKKLKKVILKLQQ